jgi:hypothetical protein
MVAFDLFCLVLGKYQISISRCTCCVYLLTGSILMMGVTESRRYVGNAINAHVSYYMLFLDNKSERVAFAVE